MGNRPVGRWLLRGLWVAAFVCIATTVAGVALNYCPVPFWDEWDGVVGFVDHLAAGDSGAWWRPHNEHRILLPRVLFWLDALCGERLVLPLIANLLLAAAAALLFVRCLQQRLPRAEDRGARHVLAAVVAMLLFSWTQSVNWRWGFQCQFFLAQVLPLLGLVLLAHSRTSLRPRTALALAAACGILSLGTMANAIATLPVFAVAAAAMRLGWRVVLLFTAAGIGGILVYFHGFMPIDGRQWLATASDPLVPARFVCGFLGSPCFHLSHRINGSAEAAGLLYLVLFAVALRGCWSRGRDAVELAMLACGGSVVVAAFAAAFGRADLDAAPWTGRYTTPALTGWCALLVALAPRLAAVAGRWPRAFAIAAVVVALPLLVVQRQALRVDHRTAHQRELAALALELGVRDASAAAALYPEPEQLRALAEPAQRAGRFVFGLPPLRGLRAAIGRPCPASREVVAAAPPTLRPIAGDADHLAVDYRMSAATAPSGVWLTDPGGRAVGFALVESGVTTQHAHGYVLAAAAQGTLRLFAAR